MSNPFDELGNAPDWTDTDKEKFERLDYLIHKVFSQSDDGAELLGIWKEHLTMSPGMEGHENAYQIGMREGVKSMIRNIILTIRKVENA